MAERMIPLRPNSKAQIELVRKIEDVLRAMQGVKVGKVALVIWRLTRGAEVIIDDPQRAEGEAS